MNLSSESPTTPLLVEHVAWNDPRAEALREAMEEEMSVLYSEREGNLGPDQKAALDRALSVDPENVFATVLVLDSDGTPLGHAALRDLRGEWEMKRVIVDSTRRGLGIGGLLMQELEKAARAGGAPRIILQTGDLQQDAIRLYERYGYTGIPTYEPYVETIPFAICYELVLD